MLPLNEIDNSWTLFLDRDGVINEEKYMDYIHTWQEFVFYDGVLKAFEIFKKKFNKIIIVTNQRGVGTGVTKMADLETIHQNMLTEIENNNGRVDAVYYSSDTSNEAFNRKPNPGMGLRAAKHFTDIDLSKAIMVGNTMSDMEFAKNLKIYTVFLPTTRPEVDVNDKAIDAVYSSLYAFALALL